MDIIRDILDRVAHCMGLDDSIRDILDLVEREVRRDWGGDRPYIAKVGETAALETAHRIAHRNAQILRDWRNGERTALLARRYGISPRRVRQIIAETP